MGSYIPSTPAERSAMLAELGLKTPDDLFAHLPAAVRTHELNIPNGLSELEVSRVMEGMASRNTQFTSIFRGAGAYWHYIPAIVRTVTSKEEFLTSYTPYRAEISQGVLQSIFEYQTQICELTGMDVSNASMYDGASASAEAVFMCEERKRSGVVLSDSVDPQIREVIATYCESRGVPVVVLPSRDGVTDCEAVKAALAGGTPASVFVQSPNYWGLIEPVADLAEIAHGSSAKLIMNANPVSLGMLKTPAELGADIAVGEGQPLGLPLSFGGPYIGYLACRKDLMRRLPGRIVGQTEDNQGRRCFVLTLQAREQHIRREKASSNICSNEALCAMTVSVYLASIGAEGLERAARASYANAHYLAEELDKAGFHRVHAKEFFHEFLTECPVDAQMLCQKLADAGILCGLPVDGRLLWCCTEMNSRADLEKLLSVIREVC
ncbi:MAG: aminomethyl-transferring glycine dehydrogenase subunit GcvPA [Mailhella sp.]|nr:aminomethyl-transferring glycine dehydrogenase subunit GcvPA [Mailhella sp.]